MLLNCSRSKKLTVDKMNFASGLELHRFYWLEGMYEIWDLAEDSITFSTCNRSMSHKRPHWCCAGFSSGLGPESGALGAAPSWLSGSA